MPFYDEKSKTWNMYYTAYCCDLANRVGWGNDFDGRIVRAISKTPGPDGFVGPWKDVGIAMEADWEPWKEEKSKPWEGMMGVDSMSPPFRGADGQWLVFYGSAQTQHKGKNPAHQKWGVGLAQAPAPTGPWKRLAEGNPVPFFFPAMGICVVCP